MVNTADIFKIADMRDRMHPEDGFFVIAEGSGRDLAPLSRKKVKA
jgi:hypothetical protein